MAFQETMRQLRQRNRCSTCGGGCARAQLQSLGRLALLLSTVVGTSAASSRLVAMFLAKMLRKIEAVEVCLGVDRALIRECRDQDQGQALIER